MLGLFVFMQSCAPSRVTDAAAQEDFHKKGVPLTTKTDTINGHALHYAITGSDTAATIVFIHGSPGSWDDYKKYLYDSLLITKFRVIAIDRPGFGYSDYGQPMHLQPQVDIIAQLLVKLQNGKPLYLVGHSYGGPVVAALSAEYPHYMDGIVILAGAVDLQLEKPEKWRTLLINKFFRYFLPTTVYTSNAELWYLKKDLVGLKEKLPNYPGDVYVFHGQKDMLVDVGNAPFIKDNYTHARSMHVHYFPKENHFIPWTQHNVIRDTLMTFPAE